MSDSVATTFSALNYSGVLYNKGNEKTPLLSMIGGRVKYTNSNIFVCGQYYNSGDATIPEISETASLTAPEATLVTRSQVKNTTQIFQESFYVSYAHQSNMGRLFGVNKSGQIANPLDEVDFQAMAKAKKIAASIEKTFIQGTFNEATTDAEVNKTCGLVSAITTNVVDAGGSPLSIWNVNDAMQKIYNSNGDIEGLILLVDAFSLNQLNASASENNLTAVEADRTINGISLRALDLPMGRVYIRLGQYLPAGTALLLNINAIAPVEQPVPSKGNFFTEELAKTGAGAKYQIFGQIGLDYGMEFLHAKITGIQNSFVAPDGVKNVRVVNPVATIETAATLRSAATNAVGGEVEKGASSKCKVTSVVYDIAPKTAPTLAYEWQIKAGGQWGAASTLSGYQTSEVTIGTSITANTMLRCKVTATGSAEGTVYSDEVKIVDGE